MTNSMKKAALTAVLLLFWLLGAVNVSAQEKGDHTPADMENMTVLTTASMSTGEDTVYLEVGDVVKYEGYSTNYFMVEGKAAYCLEPLKTTPSPGEYEVQPLEKGRLRKGMYYVYGGPGYETYVSSYGYLGHAGGFVFESEYCMSHCILAYLYSGSQDAFTGLDDGLISALMQEIDWIMTLPDPPASFYAFTFNSGGSSQTMGGTGEDRVGRLEVYKKSDRPEWTEGNACYTLADAVFGVYRPGEKEPVCVIRTDEEGYGRAEGIPAGNYEIAELENPEGFALDGVRKNITVKDGETVKYSFTDKAQHYPAGLLITKKDEERDSGKAQGEGTLADAEFTVRYYAGYYDSDPAAQGLSPVKTWVFCSDSEGKVMFTEDAKSGGDDFFVNSYGENVIPLGTITIQETKAPKGYLINDQIYVHGITPDGTGEKDTVYLAPAVGEQAVRGGVRVGKWDSETENGEAQGEAVLEGAKIQLISLNETPVVVDGTERKKGEVITTLVTGEDGTARTDSDYLPYGTYRLKETEAPKGYNNTGVTVRDFSVRENGVIVNMDSPDTAIKNDVIRGGFEIIKFCQSADGENEQKTPLKGVAFTITSEATGEKYEIVTDENGYASTEQLKLNERGDLVFGTYIVSESVTPEGLKPVEDFRVTISEEGQTLHYILENTRITCPVRLIKTDSTTGKTIPLAGAEFRLLDSEKNPVAMTVKYPSESVHETFCTDETGSFLLPEKLPAGIYYFQEVHAPAGYLLNGELLKFRIEEGHDWKDPFVVKFDDSPAKGRIRIVKTDVETGKPLKGTVFEIRAKEDIVTPDGTVRAEKGSTVATLITGEDGTAESDELFPGKYEIRETAQTSGYVRRAEPYEIELTYTDQNAGVVTEEIQAENVPTEVIIEKQEKDTEKPLGGVEFTVWREKNSTQEEDLNKEQQEEGGDGPWKYVTDENGRIRLRGLHPGKYCIQETGGLAGYMTDSRIYEVTIDESGRIDGKEGVTLTIENARTQITDTRAFWKENRSKTAVCGEDNEIIDLVQLKNLQPGTEYTLRGVLMDRNTGQKLSVDGENITAEKSFTAEEYEEEIEMTFSLDTAGLGGRKIVVYEVLYSEGKPVDSHEDIGDEDQTVEVLKAETAVRTGDEVRSLEIAAFLTFLSAGAVTAAAVSVRKNRRHGMRKNK